MKDLDVGRGIWIPGSELVLQASRASGPGGQHGDKASTRVTLRWNVPASSALDGERRVRLVRRLGGRLTAAGDLVVHAERHRSQARNLEDARRRLAEIVGEALRPLPQRRATRPTRASRERRMEAKRQRAELKRQRRGPRDGRSHGDDH